MITQQVVRALGLVVLVCVTVRVLAVLITPVLPGLVVIFVMTWLILRMLAGPRDRSGGDLF